MNESICGGSKVQRSHKEDASLSTKQMETHRHGEQTCQGGESAMNWEFGLVKLNFKEWILLTYNQEILV